MGWSVCLSEPQLPHLGKGDVRALGPEAVGGINGLTQLQLFVNGKVPKELTQHNFTEKDGCPKG